MDFTKLSPNELEERKRDLEGQYQEFKKKGLMK